MCRCTWPRARTYVYTRYYERTHAHLTHMNVYKKTELWLGSREKR